MCDSNASKKLFFKELYWDNEIRKVNQKNLEKDQKQWEINETLKAKERHLCERLKSPQDHKIYFIIGVPRSGTTMLSQLLVNHFDLGAFYNKVAKYYSVPLVGFDKLLNSQNNNDKSKELNSSLGHTIGDFSPHEFGYFWQYWLNHQGSDELDKKELEKIDWENLRSKIYAITNLLNKSLMVKSLVYNDFIIKKLAQVFPTSYFIYIKRDFKFVCQSIIESRIKQYGSDTHWWSIRPKQYQAWQNLSVEDQVAKQTVYVSKQIENDLKDLPKERVLNLSYEKLINNQYFEEISSFLDMQNNINNGNLLLKSGNFVRLSNVRMSRLIESISKAKDYYDYECC